MRSYVSDLNDQFHVIFVSNQRGGELYNPIREDTAQFQLSLTSLRAEGSNGIVYERCP